MDTKINQDDKPDTLESRFAEERSNWINMIDEMSQQMKKVFDIPDLMTRIYTERQRAVDYYHYLLHILIKTNKEYRAKYAERYDYYTYKSPIRYPNESSKNNKIMSELGDMVERRETIEGHSKFILSSISTIDNVIYAIPKRIEIDQIQRGK